MQASWEVLNTQEDPGFAEPLMGVYIGIQQMEYGSIATPHLQKMGPFTATGGPFSVAAGRLSYTYGLKGPAVCVRLMICIMVVRQLKWHEFAAVYLVILAYPIC